MKQCKYMLLIIRKYYYKKFNLPDGYSLTSSSLIYKFHFVDMKYLFIFFLPLLMLSVSCTKGQPPFNSVKVKNESNQVVNHSKILWEEISLPIFAKTLLLHDDHILVSGENGIVSINSANQVKKFPAFKIQKEYLTSDGGFTKKPINSLEKFPGDEKPFPYVCSPESSTYMSNSLYIFSLCDRSAQLWKVIFSERETLLNIINFPYNDDESILGPTRLPNSISKVLLPSFTKKGSGLVTINERTEKFELLWQGSKRGDEIASVYFIGRQGWMLLSGGKLLRSVDEGNSWQYLSNIPTQAEYNVIELKFRNELEGYIVGLNGLILSTIDGGKNWTFEDSNINTSLFKFDINNELIVAAGPYNGLVMKQKNKSDWVKIENKPEGDVDDLILFNNRLYILVGERLYFTEISNEI